jgi:hypothetical protein
MARRPFLISLSFRASMSPCVRGVCVRACGFRDAGREGARVRSCGGCRPLGMAAKHVHVCAAQRWCTLRDTPAAQLTLAKLSGSNAPPG